MNKLKYYVTFKRSYTVTHQVEADDEKSAIEEAVFKSTMEELPVDIGDYKDEFFCCISETAYNFYNKTN